MSKVWSSSECPDLISNGFRFDKVLSLFTSEDTFITMRIKRYVQLSKERISLWRDLDSSSGISCVKAVQTGFTSADGEHPQRGGRHVEFGRNFAEKRRRRRRGRWRGRRRRRRWERQLRSTARDGAVNSMSCYHGGVSLAKEIIGSLIKKQIRKECER